MKYLVTGGAGFIGSHIAEALVRRGAAVRIFDNLSAGEEENIESFRRKVEFARGDLRDKSEVRSAVKGVDIVFHEAAVRSVPRSIDNPLASNDTNITGTLKLLMACREARVKRVIYASSSSVYGDNRTYPQAETLRPSPVSPYAVSKLTAEYYMVMFTKTFGVDTVSLRYFNVFGPRQSLESRYATVVPQFMSAALKKQPLAIHSDGRQSRDFTYIDTVVQANLLASKAGARTSGEVFNIACGCSYSILELAAEIQKAAGYPLKKVFYPLRAGDVRKTVADISKAKKILKFRPSVGFAEGVRRTWEWWAR
jgi:nucleoside-diphosphate-sugar epimerase